MQPHTGAADGGIESLIDSYADMGFLARSPGRSSSKNPATTLAQ
jgi:hypothetical protein